MNHNKRTNNIALIGFSTTGKTRVGKKVAECLKWDYIDIDDEIVKIAGKGIPEIFDQNGETEFRQLESKLLQKACEQESVVISTGGGAILDSENRNKLIENCVVVCLEAKVETIYRRLLNDTVYSTNPVVRPLLSGDNPLDRINEFKSSRQLHYSIADWTVHTDNLTIDEVGHEVIKGWSYIDRPDRVYQIGENDLACVIQANSSTYPVFTGWEIMDKLGQKMKQAGLSGTAIIISDRTVFSIYGNVVRAALEKSGFIVEDYVVPPGEISKNIEEVLKAWDFLIQKRIERNDVIVALGGGMIGDMAGFVAATYLRGIPWIQVPTTLISMTDASIGGKVAVDHSKGKNLIGAFYQPNLVLSDIQTLSSLPERELRSGWAEVIKHGLILDKEFFSILESNAEDLLKLKPQITSEVIARSASIKAMVVSLDEKETGMRTLLNFGHTIAHGLEAATNYNHYFHGEAVAIGMVAASKLSERLGFLSEEKVKRITDILLRFNLPVNFSGIDVGKVLKAMEYDKKVRNKIINWIVLEDIGKSTMYSGISTKDVEDALEGVNVS
jgi:3-dehydroquinate synthase